ncbi:ferritin family protein [Chloroflexota bacterium]
MATEQDKTLEALKIAIQMEIDGKEYYLKASRESSNELGTRLLQTLADEEDFHREKFEEIYDILRTKKTWPVIDLKADRGKGLRTVFAMATGKLGSTAKGPASELEAVQKAMSMENKTYDFYISQALKANYDAEKDFYQSLAAEEKTHHLVLLDYYEYLKDPAGWFVQKEHPSLDGS